MTENYSIEEVQNILLDLLKQFEAVCAKHNLKYMGIYGTCLGAVRHKGFIPWDDDMDVMMPLKDYLKLKSLPQNIFEKGYEIYNPDAHEHFYSNAIFLHNINTTAIGNNWVKYPDCYKGISIDILPVAGLPKGRIRQMLSAFKLFRWTLMSRMTRLPLDGQEGWKQKTLWHLCNIVRKRNAPFNYYNKKIEDYFSKFRLDESDKVIFLAKWRIKDIHKYATYYNMHSSEDFVDTTIVPFEGITIPIPKGYDHIMSKEYGDYMKMPPKELQTPVHENAIVDINKSYEEYVDKVL